MGSKTDTDKSVQYDEKEAQERFDAALRGAMNAPHKPLKATKAKAKSKTRKPTK